LAHQFARQLAKERERLLRKSIGSDDGEMNILLSEISALYPHLLEAQEMEKKRLQELAKSGKTAVEPVSFASNNPSLSDIIKSVYASFYPAVMGSSVSVSPAQASLAYSSYLSFEHLQPSSYHTLQLHALILDTFLQAAYYKDVYFY
jgi:hypothetical protein